MSKSNILLFLMLTSFSYPATMTISSDSASWNKKKQILVLKGNVVLKSGSITLKAPLVRLSGQIDNPEKIIATGGVNVSDKERGATIKAETIEAFFREKKANCKGNVLIHYQGRNISSKSGFYDWLKNIAELTGSCTMTEEGKFFEGDGIKYFFDEDRIEFEGNVKGSITVQP